ncbi:hypothetical protein [Blautia luti]|uniref:Uncharacterized protein n=1 Tax=Blautia luti TaxID=89014 RepID=A0A564VBX5_9FIRM|nr:hypothetical protein [Blautia luti]VUX29869.1 Uncharacterised protein [Blautia luti]
MDPKIQKSIHLGTFSHVNQLMNICDWKEEKSNVFFAGKIVGKRCIVFGPVYDLVSDDAIFLMQGVSQEILFCQGIQNRKNLVLKPETELMLQFFQCAAPFSRSNIIGQMFYVTVG